VKDMNETFWKWFKEQIDGNFITHQQASDMLSRLRSMDEGISIDVGRGYAERSAKGVLISKYEMILVAENERAKQIVIQLAASAPELSTWKICINF